MSHATIDPPANEASLPERQPAPSRRRGGAAAVFSALIGSVPTLCVLALLGGVGYYGHHSGWKLPKFSALAGAKPAEKADWCEEHGVPESQCVECHPELFPKGPDYGFCHEHGVHNCPLDHPDVAQLKTVPGDLKGDFARAARALAVDERKQNNAVCQSYTRRIQFASAESVRQAGVDVELVERRAITEAVAGNGEIRYDPTRLANLSSRVPGAVWRVEKTIGDPVKAGEVLALVDAVEVGQAKSRLAQALVEQKLQRQNVDRLKAVQGTVAGRQVLEAEAALAKAQAAVLSAEQSLINLGLPVNADGLKDLSEREVIEELRFLGVPDAIREDLHPRMTTANLLPVCSSMDGVVVDRQVVAGEVVDASRVLFQVGDTSRMWLFLNVPLEQADKISAGQTVRFKPDGSPKEFTGKLNWVSTAADRETRMVRVRAELPNPSGQLRDETFGTGRVILREEENAIVVPSQAIHTEGCCQIVFVRDKGYFDSPQSPKLFHVRTIRLGAKADGFTEVLAGVLPGEVVATKGSDVLRSQLLKNNLGAGCCGDD